MSISTVSSIHPALVPLEWETNHFGISVAQLNARDCELSQLDEALRAARNADVRLVVWPSPLEAAVPESLLKAFGGKLVDRKVTFARRLDSDDANAPPKRSDGLKVVTYSEPAAGEELVQLAIEAGVYSRFNTDEHFARGKFEAMYRIWIERSVRRELASAVLVVPLEATASGSPALGGMVTISLNGELASIGLIAVASQVRGLGLGSHLLRAAHDWMRAHGAARAQVVTQLDNAPACRLYRQGGYQPERIQPYYHFWL